MASGRIARRALSNPLAWDRPAALGAEALERLREQPGGPALLALAEPREDVELVGGAVRDLLLGRVPRELDVVVAADASALAQALAVRLGGEVTVHERFGTALVEHGEVRVDVATRRAESYPAPGALPQVRAGTPEEDLLRRDFTVNAIAVGLGGARRGELRCAPFALEDLRARRLRVLHERSFSDDPTRLLRLARYRGRLGFAVENHTEQLALQALGGDAHGPLRTVSGARVGAELRLALAEADPLAAVAALRELGLLAALHPGLSFDGPLLCHALELLPQDGRPDLLVLAALVLPLTRRAEDGARAAAREWLDWLEFPHGDRDRALAAAVGAVRLREALPRCECAAELYAEAYREPLEGVALAGALDVEEAGHEQAAECAAFWLEHLRHVGLQITGEDLLAAGVPQGPEVGNRLLATLLLRVNGQVGEGREAQLRTALELPAEVALDSSPPRPRPRSPRRRRPRRGSHG